MWSLWAIIKEKCLLEYLVCWKHSRSTWKSSLSSLSLSLSLSMQWIVFNKGTLNALVGHNLLICFENLSPVSTYLSLASSHRHSKNPPQPNLLIIYLLQNPVGNFLFTDHLLHSLSGFCVNAPAYVPPVPSAITQSPVWTFLPWLHNLRVGILQGSGIKQNFKSVTHLIHFLELEKMIE